MNEDNDAVAWRTIDDPDDLVEALCRLYDERGGERYSEVVTQTEHAVQAAELAMAAASTEATVIAALLHDIGHLLLGESERDAGRDFRHEDVGARFLANWFGRDVTEPIRLHVDAKRYLCAVDDAYHDGLSPASVHSLVLQGGPMDAAEAASFEARAGSEVAVELRRWDDMAKDAGRPTGAVRDFAPLIRRQLDASRSR